jgi:lipopolysaccharide export system ATP-binding protein
VKLTDNVWFSNGKDEFRGDVVIYNVRDERVQINPGGQGRVRGIIRPRQGTAATAPAPAAPQPRRSPRAAHESAARRGARQKVSLAPGRQGPVAGSRARRSRRLLGPNGAGKTTAFYMIVGLVPTDAGRIIIDDQDVSRLPVHRRARLGLGYLPQEPSVFRKLSVRDNIHAILETRPELDAQRREAMLESLLDELHIGHIRDSLGQSLSGGERRRVEIARALAAEPQFMLLDEPFAGVDPISVLDIQRSSAT